MATSPAIYIIDDDKDDQEILIEAVADIDPAIQCYTASNGEEGLRKIFHKLIPTPIIIFLDLNMPKVHGKEALARLKAHPDTASIFVVMYSTSSYEADIRECKRLGSYDYWVKDEDFNHLKTKIRTLLEQLQVIAGDKNPHRNVSDSKSDNTDRD